jgi:hypothetical protein
VQDEDRLRKISPSWVAKYHVVDKINHGETNGFIDINGGITIADKVIFHCLPVFSLLPYADRQNYRHAFTRDSYVCKLALNSA